jgi:hypothetical protein
LADTGRQNQGREMKDTKWYRVSLRFFGDALDVDAVEAVIGLAPTYMARKGTYISDNSRSARHLTNYWARSFTPDADTSIPFAQQIGDILDILEPHEHNMRELLRTPGIEGEFFLGFSSNGQGGGHFPRLILERVSNLGLGLDLDLYPPTIHTETSARTALYSSGELPRPVPLEVSLVEFIQTGALGQVEVGMNQEMVEAIVGPPSRWVESSHDQMKVFVWHYGDISLTFENEILEAITMGDFEIPAVGNSIIMSGSILTNCLTLSQIAHELDEEFMTYGIESHLRSKNQLSLVVEGGATLTFKTEYESEPVLIYISYQLKKS